MWRSLKNPDETSDTCLFKSPTVLGAMLEYWSPSGSRSYLHEALVYTDSPTKLPVKGADPNKSHNGKLPLLYALYGFPGQEVTIAIKKLLEAGADIHLKDNSGLSFLDAMKRAKEDNGCEHKRIR